MNGLSLTLIITGLLIVICWNTIANVLYYIQQGFSLSKAIELARNEL